MITREQGQDYAIEFALAHKKLRLVYPPGYGKSRIACKIMEAINLAKIGPVKGLVITDTVDSRDRVWPVEMGLWNVNHLRITKQVRICRYENLEKWIGKYDFIICDEASAFTEASSQAFFRCQAEYKIFMTATEPNRLDKPRMLSFFNYVIPDQFRLEITIDQAVAWGHLNEYRIRIFEYEIVGDEWERYLDICRSLERAIVSGNQTYQHIVRTARMDFIYNLSSKVLVTNYVKERLKNERRIIFTMRKHIADKVSPNVYHSGTGSECLEAFLEEAIIELATCKSLRYGQNFKNLRYVICSQIDSLKRNFVQTLGRALRLVPGETAEVWLICAKNTVDADWVRKATKDFKKSNMIIEQLNLKT